MGWGRVIICCRYSCIIVLSVGIVERSELRLVFLVPPYAVGGV